MKAVAIITAPCDADPDFGPWYQSGFCRDGGMKVVVVKALENGYIDIADLKAKASQHAANLSGIMITYPSTYGFMKKR